MNNLDTKQTTADTPAERAIYDAAIDAGRIAYLAGQPETDCPYLEPGHAREGWLDGYHG